MSKHHQRLDRRRWARVRLEVLDRDGWRCTSCRGYGNEADHIVPLDRGGASYDPSNLQTLCGPCHSLKTAGERGREPTPTEQEWRAFVRELQQG